MYKNLLQGFQKEEERNKIQRVLLKLFKYIDPKSIVFCGGLAIRYHFAQNQIELPSRKFNDLDLQLEHLEDINTAITKDFLTSHYHKYERKDDFYAAIVDPENKIKLDIFSYIPYPPLNPMEIEFEGYKVRIKNPEDQLTTQILEIKNVLEGNKVESKRLDTIEKLIKFANLKEIDTNLLQTFKEIKSQIQNHPEQILEKPSKKSPYVCKDCTIDNNFPITPMTKIFEILDLN